MNSFTAYFGSLLFALSIAALPIAASAQGIATDTHAQAHVGISSNGVVHVIGADVTSVSGAVINAVTTLGTTVIDWVVNTSAATKVNVGGHTTATTTAIAAGDTISFTGALTSIGSTMTVVATNVRDLAGMLIMRFMPVTVDSVNAANDSFTANAGRHAVTVEGTASTTVTLNGAASTIAALQSGDRARVMGTTSADGSIITASTVTAKSGAGRTSDGFHLGILGWGDELRGGKPPRF